MSTSRGPRGLQVDLEKLERLAPAQQEEVKRHLAELEDAYKRNPLLGYRPHPKQQQFHSPPFPPIRAFFGGNRSGKTVAVVADTVIQAIDPDSVPAHLRAYKRWQPPCKIRVVTPDLTATLDGVIHEELRRWCPAEQLRGGNFTRAFDKLQRVLKFKNGSWIQFNSSEQDREKLGGVALHRVVYDEEPRREVRSECFTRLIDYDGEELFAMTPFSGMGWLYDELYDPWERGLLEPQDARVIVVDMDDNPYLSEEGKRRALAKYTGPEREARKSGMFVSFAGRIYPGFMESGPRSHVIPQVDTIPVGAEVFRGIDPGYRHMCGVVYCYLDADDQLVVFDEIAMRQATVAEVCKEMERRNARWGVKKQDGNKIHTIPLSPHFTVIDPAARNKNLQTGRSDQQEFADHGVFTMQGQNAISAGINRVNERILAGKLHVTANCQELIGEFRRYRWVQDTGRGEDDARERPVKRDDHLLDALRYAIMARPLVPKPSTPEQRLSPRDQALKAHFARLERFGRRPVGTAGPGQWA